MSIFSKILRFSSDPSSITSLTVIQALGIVLMLMVFIYYLYSMASSSNSSEPKIMVSPPTSSIQTSFKYDVFLSFRGEDTRKNFLGHLYEALNAKGIYTYKDDVRIHKGKTISDELIKAIENSRFYIIVFSKNYASSSWCLDELVKIMECQKKDEHTAYPVFYDVEPTEVRNQIGAVENAFSKNKEKEAAGKWREALKEAGGLAGWELRNTLDGDESELIKKIVGLISLELRSISFGSDEKLIGMETRVKDVVDSLEMGTDDDKLVGMETRVKGVWMIGIKGMGGAGKTTTARAVFNRLSNDFEAKIFVSNVREVSKPSMSGLKKLQKQVLSDVMKGDVTVNDVTHGINMMQERMRGTKVLLVLDDVDHIEQLEALAGGSNWFKPGSRIIVTTRNEQVLEAHRVKFQDIDLVSNKDDHRVKIRDIDLLSDEEAIFLLSRHAFGRASPPQEFKELSGKVVHYAAGLPLTLKVLGSSLCGKNKQEWKDSIKRLKKIPLPKEIQERLELSYESLEDDYKKMFLDIACILKGLRREDAIRILECCGFNPIIGLRVLEQRCLITIYSKEFDPVLGMHDHIEEMGKNIVRREHPNPNKHSRLWIKEEIEDILVDDEGTEATICLELRETNTNAGIVMKGLGKMKKLRYLQVHFPYQDYCERDAEDLDNTAQYFSKSLEYLNCTNYPFLYLPKTFQANNLVGLEIKRCRRMERLWEEGEKKVLPKLKFLSLKESNLTTFDFRITSNLKTLSLEDSPNLVELFMPVSCQKLNHLHISKSKLITFDLQLTPNLERLTLDNCADFEKLHLSSACPNLKFLKLCKSRLRSLDLELFPNLESLDLEGCADYEELQVSSACPNLKFLKLCKSRLRSLDLELFPNLERLDLQGCDELVKVNAPVGCLKNVGYLKLDGCLRFSNFVISVGGSEPKVSRSSASLRLVGESLDLCPLHPNINLPKFQFDCDYEENLPSSVGNIEKLISFGLCACTDIKKFSDMICSLQWLRKLELKCDIQEFSEDLGKLECLEKLYLSSTKIKHLPDSICLLKCLKSLKVDNGDLLEKLPDDLCQLECLEELYVRSKKIEFLPDSICMLKCLKSLEVDNGDLLEKLPENLGQLECLEELYVRSKKIEFLPDSICMLKRLKWLNVGGCSCLGKLPEDIGQLESLESLDFSGTKIKHLPDSICMLKHLTYLNLDDCALVGLDMYNTRMEQLWEEGEKKDLKEVKFLSLSNSALTTFDFSMTPSLKTLILSSDKLVKLCMPVSCQELKHLDISDSKLRTFDLDMGFTPNLSLDDCADFEAPHVSSAFPHLRCLYLDNTCLRSLDLGFTPYLEKLSLNYCADFENFHPSRACPNLKFLGLRKTRLRRLDLELFPNLQSLDLEGCDKLVQINAPVGCLRKLVYLNLNSCLRFSYFVVPVGELEPKDSRSSASLCLVSKSLARFMLIAPQQ